MTRGALRGQTEIPDWYPEDRRGEMPGVVRSGREGVRACGLCHLADGSGRPENAPVNGLHVAYFIQQMDDFKNGLRRSADPRKANTNLMAGFAKAATPGGWTRWQATSRPPATGRSRGSIREHAATATGQRGWKRQPDGGSSADGSSPTTAGSVGAPGTPAGTESARARV